MSSPVPAVSATHRGSGARLRGVTVDDMDGVMALHEPSGRMLGMAMARRLPRQYGKPSKAELMDLAVLPACGPAHVLILLRTCQAWAKSRGVAVLDAKRWTGAMADQLAQSGARIEPLPGAPYGCAEDPGPPKTSTGPRGR